MKLAIGRRQHINRVQEQLIAAKPAWWRRVHTRRVRRIARAFYRWKMLPAETVRQEMSAVEDDQKLLRFLVFHANSLLSRIEELNQEATVFSNRLSVASSQALKRQVMLDFAQSLSTRGFSETGDRRAFGRFFGQDVLLQRFRNRLGELEFETVVLFECLPDVVRRLAGSAGVSLAWNEGWLGGIDDLTKRALLYARDERLGIQALRCAHDIFRALQSHGAEGALTPDLKTSVRRLLTGHHESAWKQVAAVRLFLAAHPSEIKSILADRLFNPLEGDDLFVREAIIRSLVEKASEDLEAATLLMASAQMGDPSPHVRQELAGALHRLPEDLRSGLLQRLFYKEPEDCVRAAALLSLVRLDGSGDSEIFLAAVEHALENGGKFLKRVALLVAVRWAEKFAAVKEGKDCLRSLNQRLHEARDKDSSAEFKSQVSDALEVLWVMEDADRRSTLALLGERLRPVAAGKTIRLSLRKLPLQEAMTLVRILSVLAQDDYGFDVRFTRWRMVIRKGDAFGFRLWRFLHEIRQPSSDKRQAYSHTCGRLYAGQYQVPSRVMAELSETKVPGEPLYIDEEGHWRPYLPLLDQVVSSLDLSPGQTPLRVVTSQGTLEIIPPGSIMAKIKAYAALTWRFASYARLRNWRSGDDNQQAAQYLSTLARHGFSFRLVPHEPGEGLSEYCDPQVARFVPVVFPFSLTGLVERFEDYAVSLYQNSLRDLAIFCAALASGFLVRHLWSGLRLRRLRRRIPLVIGGWGTRGKSGTERLKAALFNAVGLNVFSKTTGCEAMFVHAPAMNPLQELFLFRPYDKATIWEQADVLNIAVRLDADVFLWECMGLTPSYIQILQQQWMQDDISTITNTYPDHEDLQGPAGIDIPKVMTNFIPRKSVLLSSEEQMHPILREAACKQETEYRGVGWLQAGMIAPDILARFPYDEHPHNIALVVALGQVLGIPRSFALKEMADRVVADLGVLKTYPRARIRGRDFEFVMGMSANERLGTMGNWKRTGFAGHDPEVSPGTWVTTVVNNRADRIARSRVFASILVNDISADRHILIGTNLDGLQSYIRESLAATSAHWSLWDDGGEGAWLGEKVLTRQAARLHVPRSEQQLQARVAAMLEGLQIRLKADELISVVDDETAGRQLLEPFGLEPAIEGALISHAQRFAGEYETYKSFLERIRQHEAKGTYDEGLDRDLQELLSEWFTSKLVVIENPHATADEIMSAICEATPPGMLNRIMGLQNIKGTGLGFVYGWQDWERCYQACQKMLGMNLQAATSAMMTLGGFQKFNLLCQEAVQSALDEAELRPIAQGEMFSAQAAVIRAALKQSAQDGPAAPATTSHGLTGFFEVMEKLLDPGDAVRRRKSADRIYRDLMAERISYERAAQELKLLNARQKGGWLASRYL